MKLDKQFIGAGLDFNSSSEFIGQYDLISAFNCRSMGTGEGELGCITSIEGNVLVEHPMPLGINKCIGGKAFDDVSKAYYFIYNSNDFHRIEEYDYDSNVITTIFENKTDSNGKNILKLLPKKPVKDIVLIDGFMLKFNDANTSPKEIDIKRKKAGQYGVVTASDLEQIKAQPLRKMMVKYISNPSRNINSVSKKLFQFRYKYVYLNNEESAWSVYSDRATPTDEPTPSQVSDVTKNNGLEVSLDIGTDRVRDIIISGRIGNQDWFTIKTVAREDILKITNSTVNPAQEIFEAYVSTSPNIDLFSTIGIDPFSVKNSYIFLFYYDGLFEYDDPLLTDLAHDHLPRVANAMELANNNVMLFGGIREGYPRPKQDIALNVTYYDPQISITPTDFSDAMRIEYGQERNSGSHTRTVIINMQGLPKTGDKITVKMLAISTGQIFTVAEYYVPSSQNNLLSLVSNSLASLIPGASANNINPVGRYIIFRTQGFQELSSVTIDYAHKTTGESKSIPILKTNSAYQPALGYKDEFGRFFPIQTDKDFILNTQSIAQTSGLVPKIDWKINSAKAPEGAKTYQWLLSKNNTHVKSLNINGSFKEVTDNSYISISLKSLIEFNNENPSSILGYDYAEGDRCTFQYYLDSSDVPKYFSSSLIDVDVVSFGPKMAPLVEGEDPVVEDYILKVRRPSSIDISGFYNGSPLIGKELLIEIYSPKKGTSAEEAKVYYEVGDVYMVNDDGTHSVTSGSIKAGDAYYKTRENGKASNQNQVHVFKVEDLNFSDFYASNFYSLGRPRSFYDTPEDVYLKASIRFSGTYNKYTDNNGLTRFFKENIVDYDEIYGAIQYLEQRDNIVVCIQELKVGYIPVNQSIIEDQAGQQNVAVSEVFLNKIRYSRGVDLGIGKAINSYVSYGGFIYFVDPNKCEPVRVGLDGIDTISKKASKYFKKTIRDVYASGRDILGFYDVRNEEYIINYANVEDEVVSVDLSSANWTTADNYSIAPESLTISQLQTSGLAVYSPSDGFVTYTPSNGVSGSGHIKFSFVANGAEIFRGECINITAALNAPTPFSFFNKVNAELNLPYDSNTIGVFGITVPVPISVSAGQYSVNEGPWLSAPSTVKLGDLVRFRLTASGTVDTLVSGVMTIGSYSAPYSVRTKTLTKQVFVHIGLYGNRQLKVELRNSDVYGQGSLAPMPCNVPLELKWNAIFNDPDQVPIGQNPVNGDIIERTESMMLISGQTLANTASGEGHDTVKCVFIKQSEVIDQCGGSQLRLVYVYQPSLLFC